MSQLVSPGFLFRWKIPVIEQTRLPHRTGQLLNLPVACRIPSLAELDGKKDFADIPAVCIMDAGNNGVLILADKMLPPRKHGVLLPGPQNHWFKLGFEKYFIWKMRNGKVTLP